MSELTFHSISNPSRAHGLGVGPAIVPGSWKPELVLRCLVENLDWAMQVSEKCRSDAVRALKEKRGTATNSSYCARPGARLSLCHG